MTRGQKIREMRRRAGITQEVLAERVGAAQGNISQIEHDARGVSASMFIALLRACCLDESEIQGLTVEYFGRSAECPPRRSTPASVNTESD